jgi:hypothetical protein
MAVLTGIGGERYWVHIPSAKPRAYKSGGLVAAAEAVKGSPMANEYGDTELVHVNKYEMEKLREMWGEPGINPETGLPAYGWFGKLLGTVAKVAGTVILTPVLGPVGAAAAVQAASGVVSGDSIGQILKSTALTAATAGAAQVGGKVLPGLTGGFLNEAAGEAIGAGVGTFGGQVATGASLENALTSGVTSGLGTYASNRMFDTVVDKNILGLGDAANYLYGLGGDISARTGINLGRDTAGLFGPRASAPEIGINYENLTPDEIMGALSNAGGAAGDIVVSGIGAKGVNLASGANTNTGGDIGDEARTDTEDSIENEEEVVVTGNPATNTDLATQPIVVTGNPAKNTDLATQPIVVTGNPATNTDLVTQPIVVTGNPATNTDLVTGPIVVTGNPARNTDLVVGGGGGIGGGGGSGGGGGGGGGGSATDVDLIDRGTGATAGGNVTPLVPRGGTYDVNPNRTDIFGTRGLANIRFDPFTYGQATGNQPTEFLFFTQNPVTGAVTAAPAPITTPVANETAAPAGYVPSGNMFAEGGEINDDMASHLMAYHKNGGHTGPGQVKGIGSGQEDKIPAWLSDGEYVWSAQDVADLGDGSTDEGVRRLDKMRHMVRRRAGRKDVKKIAKPQ